MTTEIRPPAAHQKPSGKLYLSASQLNLVNNVWTVVELNTISAGFTDGIENTANHRITPGAAGLYDIKAQITPFNTVADTRYTVGIYANGSTWKGQAIAQASIASYLSLNCNVHVYLSATDYINLMAYSLAGVDTVDLYGSENYTFLSVQRVR